MTKEICKTKQDAIEICKSCGMNLNSYEDKDLVKNVEKVVQGAIENNLESPKSSLLEADDSLCPNEKTMTREEVLSIKEDLSVVKLQKVTTSTGLPTYEALDKKTMLDWKNLQSIWQKPRQKQSQEELYKEKNHKGFTFRSTWRFLHKKEYSFVLITRELPNLKWSSHARVVGAAKANIHRNRKWNWSAEICQVRWSLHIY